MLANEENFHTIYEFCYNYLEDNFLHLKNFRFDPDLGHSILRKNLIKFCIGKYIYP